MSQSTSLLTKKTLDFLIGLLLAAALWTLLHGAGHPIYLLSAVGGLVLTYFTSSMLPLKELGIIYTPTTSALRILRFMRFFVYTGSAYLCIFLAYKFLPHFVFLVGGNETLMKV